MIGIETEEPKFVFDIGLVFKLRLKYKDNFYGKGKYCGARIIGIAEINFGFCI